MKEIRGQSRAEGMNLGWPFLRPVLHNHLMFKASEISEKEKRLLTSQVLSHLDAAQQPRVLIVGDVGIDEYVNGQVVRISPEAPVPVVDVIEQSKRLGLAANVAQNIVSLGGEAVLLSVTGNDRSGEELRSLMAEAKVSADYLVVDSDRPTTAKLRVMSGQHHLVRVDFEQRRPLSSETGAKVLQRARELIENVDVVVLEDYAKGVLSSDLIQELVALAHAKGKKVLADPHRNTPLTYYRGVDLLTPNHDEAWELSKLSSDANDKFDRLNEVGNRILEQTSGRQLVVTLGKKGLALFEEDKIRLLPTFAREVYDVTGAGDTFIAAMSLAWTSGLSLVQSGVFANFAAGYVVGKVGCVACPLEEVQSYMKNSLKLEASEGPGGLQ